MLPILSTFSGGRIRFPPSLHELFLNHCEQRAHDARKGNQASQSAQLEAMMSRLGGAKPRKAAGGGPALGPAGTAAGAPPKPGAAKLSQFLDAGKRPVGRAPREV